MRRVKGELLFRRYLIEQLKTSEWPDHFLPFEEIAPRLGVQPDVLRQAQSELNASRRKEGLNSIRLGSTRTRVDPSSKIEVAIPDAIWPDLRRYSEMKHTDPSTILRSLIHRFLQQSAPPAYFRDWHYRGKHYVSAEGSRHGEWPKLHCRVSMAAHTALLKRARALKTTRTGILRGLLLDLLEGRVKQLKLIDVTAMFGDPSRYVT